jgi:hypothetical protein
MKRKTQKRNYINIFLLFLLLGIGLLSAGSVLAEDKVTMRSELSTGMQLPLIGNYTVGQGGDFETIALAARALSDNGVSGNVVFEIFAGNYQDTIFIDSVDGVGPASKVKFKTLSGARDVFLIGDHVNLTINGADFIEFEMLTFQGGVGNSVLLDGNIEDVSFHKNVFRRFQGISSTPDFISRHLEIVENEFICNINFPLPMHAVSLTGNSRSTSIIGNIMSINDACLILNNQDSLRIESNSILSSSNSMNFQGVSLTISNSMGALFIIKNVISKYNFRVGGLAVSISDCDFTEGVIANNSISGAIALIISGSSGINVLHNTLSCEPLPNEYILVLSGSNSIKMFNNLFNRREGRYGFGKFLSVSSSLIVCDYNNYCDLQRPFLLDSMFADFNGTEVEDLQSWKTLSGLDLNSATSKVLLNGVHISGPSRYDQNLKGIYCGIDTDIDGEQRSLTTPFKGADESQNVQPSNFCEILGEIYIPVNSTEIYHQDSLIGFWDLGNYTSDAFIEQSNEYYCRVNAGSTGGYFKLYFNGFDSATGTYKVLCDKMIYVESPLPVELTEFSAELSESDVELTWSTSTELNNSGFEIQRADESGEWKVENGKWSKIGFVSGGGTTNEPREYSFTERNLETGKYKYRLKQLDFNGNFEYFELAEVVSIGIPDKYDLSQNYPNPFNPVTTINYDLPSDGIVSIKVYDILGRELKTLVNEMKTAGYHKIRFNAADFGSGAYFYRMKAGDFVAVKKFVVLK